MDESAHSISLPNQKNIARFFKSFDVAQIVIIRVNQSKFLVNSVLLVLHSSVFEELIYSGAEEIFVDNSLQFPGSEDILYQCLLYLHGDTMNMDLGTIYYFYHFASFYKISSMQEQCEGAFMKLISSVETYIRCVAEWFSNEKGPMYQGLVTKNGREIIKLLTQSKNVPTILKIMWSESDTTDSLIPAMLPNQVMLDMFFTEMTKSITEPSDTLQLKVIKDKYFGDSISLSTNIDNKNADHESIVKEKVTVKAESKSKQASSISIVTKDRDSTSLKGKNKSEEDTTSVCVNGKITTESIGTIELNKCEKPSSSCIKLSAVSSDGQNRLSDLDASKSKVKDVSKFVHDKKLLNSLLFADVMNIAETIEQDRPFQNYLKIDLIFTWIFLKKQQMNSSTFSRLFNNFNYKGLSKEYLLDVEEVLSATVKSIHGVDFKDSNDDTFFISSKIMTQSHVRKGIEQNGGLFLIGSDEVCQFRLCEIKDHKINLFVLLKKTANEPVEASPVPLKMNDNIHSKILVHFYLLALDKRLYAVNIFSLKIHTKAEILKIISQYPNFVLKVVYQPLKQKSKPSSVSNSTGTKSAISQEEKRKNLVMESPSVSIELNNCEKPSSSCNKLPAVSSDGQNRLSDLDASESKVKDVSKFVHDKKLLNSLLFADVMNIAKTIEQDRPFQNYLKIDLIFTWIFHKTDQINRNRFFRLFSHFDDKGLSREYLLDVEEVLSAAAKSVRGVDFKDRNDDTFFISSKIMPQSHVRKGIEQNGGIFLIGSDEVCQFRLCEIKDHKIDLFVLLKKTANEPVEAVQVSSKRNDQIHSKNLVHFYLLALDKILYVENIFSLKLHTKAEILKIISQYPNFVLKVVYQPLKQKSKPSSVSNSTCTKGAISQEKKQENLVMKRPSVSTVSIKESPGVFIKMNWIDFTFEDVVQFIRTEYDKGLYLKHQNSIVKTQLDFAYICIDLVFTWVQISKSPLLDKFYKPLMCAFDLNPISAIFVKDIQAIFNSLLQKAVPIISKCGNEDTFLVSATLKKDYLLHQINHNGHIQPESGNLFNLCHVNKCPIKDHRLQMRINLNKSVGGFSVKVTPVDTNIHPTKLLHFYLLALDLDNQPTQLISLKLLSKYEIFEFVKRYQRFQLRLIYSNK